MRANVFPLVLVLAFVLPLPGSAEAQSGGAHDVAHTALWYLPNRLLDVLDVVRANVKVGQGIAGGVRATRGMEAFIGTYESVYLGLPGPRGGPELRSPVGFEERTRKPGQPDRSPKHRGPRYGRGEIGLDVFPFVAGAAVGVDVFELADLLGGFFLLDLAEDDR